jgi:hypothetical protein
MDLDHDLHMDGVFFYLLVVVRKLVVFHHIRYGFDILEIKVNVVAWVRLVLSKLQLSVPILFLKQEWVLKQAKLDLTPLIMPWIIKLLSHYTISKIFLISIIKVEINQTELSY